MDVDMPIMDGIQATKSIVAKKRRHEISKNLKIVLNTAFIERVNSSQLASPDVSIIAKPIQIVDLI